MKNSRSTNPVSPYCTGCGACIADSNGSLRMAWDDYGFLVPQKTSQTPVPEASIQACPFASGISAQNNDEDMLASDFLADAARSDDEVGLFEDTYIGYSRAHRETSSSGGIATYVFEQVMKRGIADHLFVVVEDGPGYRYRLISSIEEVPSTSKTRYFPVTLEEIFLLANKLEGRIAISGVACFVKAIRMRQQRMPELRDKIVFIVGIICGGLKSRYFTDYLADSAGAGAGYRNAQYRVKDAASTANDYSFSATGQDGTQHSIKMSRVGDMWGTGLFKAQACDFCTDVLTELADISLGDAWLPEYRPDGLGNSVIVTRSKTADMIMREGIASGDLCATACDPGQITKSQRPSFMHRRDALRFRLMLARLTRRPTPYVRKRVLKSISPPYAMVQLQREVTRSRSLALWRQLRSSSAFDTAMRPHLRVLRLLTRINHSLR